MSKIPDKIKRYRLPGTEIKPVGNNYYLYKVVCKWDKELHKYRKQNLGYLGRVTEEGIVEAHHRDGRTTSVPVAASYSLEFGATWLLSMVGQDILDSLKRHFGQDAEWIYAVAMLRTARHCAFRYIEHYYQVSYLSIVVIALNSGAGSPIIGMRVSILFSIVLSPLLPLGGAAFAGLAFSG